jgi:signal transduction histidine kinase
MPATKVFRGIGFRIAALTALLVLISMLVLGATAFSFVSSTMQQRLRTSIRREVATLLPHARSPTIAELRREIVDRMHNKGPRQFFYSLTSSQGAQIVGDSWLQISKPGWHRIDLKDGEQQGALSEDVIAYGMAFAGQNVLSVGRDARWITEVEDELLEILGWTLLGGVLLSMITAAIVKTLLARRFSSLAATATAIMNGNLTQRMAVTGADDDFDRLSKTLNVMLDRLAGLMENLEQVSNDIAHDLRTPLTRLRRLLEWARSEKASPSEREAAVEDGIAETDALLSTFTAVLRIAQIDAGVPRSGIECTNLSTIVGAVVEAYEPNITDGGRRLKTSLMPDVCIDGDRDLLAQMLSNLLENAVTHTPSGTTIKVALRQLENGAELCVSDDGPGVPPTEREQIFRRFYRMERSRTTPGTGLGLNLVAAVAHLHEAKVAVEDNQPGLRIAVRFPGKLES